VRISCNCYPIYFNQPSWNWKKAGWFNMAKGCELNLDYQDERLMSEDFRIELPVVLCQQFSKNNIDCFYFGHPIGIKCLVLCPSCYWDKWVCEQKKNLKTTDKTINSYLTTKSPPIILNKQGKIRIPKPYRKYFDRDVRIVHLIAKGYYVIICSAKVLSEEMNRNGYEAFKAAEN